MNMEDLPAECQESELLDALITLLEPLSSGNEEMSQCQTIIGLAEGPRVLKKGWRPAATKC